MKRTVWILLMVVVAAAHFALAPARANTMQDPFPAPCGAKCLTTGGCQVQCPNCLDVTGLEEGGGTCQWP